MSRTTKSERVAILRLLLEQLPPPENADMAYSQLSITLDALENTALQQSESPFKIAFRQAHPSFQDIEFFTNDSLHLITSFKYSVGQIVYVAIPAVGRFVLIHPKGGIMMLKLPKPHQQNIFDSLASLEKAGIHLEELAQIPENREQNKAGATGETVFGIPAHPPV